MNNSEWDLLKALTTLKFILYWTFSRTMIDKEVPQSSINSAKCVMATILHITTYSFINKHPPVLKDLKGLKITITETN